MITAMTLAGCGTVAKSPPRIERAPGTATGPCCAPGPRGGGYYLDDGPGANPPANLDSIADAVPKVEPLHRGTGRPYIVMGKSYTPMTALAPYKARGVASWYGRRYHGKKTASGDIYDMYAMTAAHTTLPIPSYVRVMNIANGRSVVVRVNDRGPFIDSRLIDLSYTAAHKLGVLGGGSAMVEVESILPGQPAPAVAVQPGAAPVVAVLQRESEPAATPLPPSDLRPAATPSVPVTRDAGGHYLQLGAFGSQENADSFLSRLKTQIDWLAQTMHIYPRDGLFRVHAGPYATEQDARLAAERISQSMGIKPMVLVR
ncbi:MAG: septal ring lytic transglycosylase RlpA family protein [Burkholderiales bacterium]|nr:septal ring lytic transglycosylase RlpA family protein [Burkholderiales bacterium]